MMRERYYIAYGSNLNMEQMGYRCPDARVCAVGKVLDYRLTFKALGTFAYATIEPFEGAYVPVVVWQISQKDEDNLDRYEGFPTHYFKQHLSVKAGKKALRGMAYIMNEKAVYQIPARQYYEVIMEGYQRFGLEECQLAEAYYRVSEGISHVENTIQFYRNMRDLTQTQLAQQSGVSIRGIQMYESGARLLESVKTDTVLRLAEVLEVPVERLLN